jgi:hypothetical protein
MRRLFPMTKLEPARWWAVKRARSHQPRTYKCPLCGRQLHAMSDHVVIAPEGDGSRRRHAHADCVRRARLVTYDEWRAAQPREQTWWRRWFTRS